MSWDQILQAFRDSSQRVLLEITQLLPGVLALIIVVAVFWGLAAFGAWIVRRVMRIARADERINRGMGAWASTQTPSELVARLVFWALMIVGVLFGVSLFSEASPQSPLATQLMAYVPGVVTAVILLFVGSLIARFLARSVLISAVNMNLQYARILSLGVKWLVLVLTAAMVLEHLAIGGVIIVLAFGILFGGIVLALALAVGLGSRDLVSRSLEREAARTAPEPMEEHVHHF
jgi:hypothetical protein